MIYLLSSLMCLGLFWATHVVWFRLRPPKRQLPALLLLGAVWLVIYLVFLSAFPVGHLLGLSDERDFISAPLRLTSISLYILLCLAYMIVYSGIEVESPSAKIIYLIYKRPECTITYAELQEIFSNERLVFPRLEDLVANGLVAFDGVRYRLLPRGAIVARLFGAYRRLLRRGIGG